MSITLSTRACAVKGEALQYISKRLARCIKFISFAELLTDPTEWLFLSVQYKVEAHGDCVLGADRRLETVISQKQEINDYATEVFQAGVEDHAVILEALWQ